MKIALVCRVYPTCRPGGMGFVCQDRARALAKLGHEVHVLTTSRNRHAGEEIQDEGVAVHHMPSTSVEYSDEFRDHCIIHCNAFEPDILHSDSFDVLRPWMPQWANGTKTVIAATMHGCCWGSYFSDVNLWMRDGGNVPEFSSRDMARERDIMLGYHRMIGISIHEHWILTNLMGLFNAKLVYNPLPDYFFDGTSYLSENPPRRFLCSAVTQHQRRGFHIAQRAADKAGVELLTVSNRPRHELPALIDSCSGLILPTTFAQGMDLAVSESIARFRPVYASSTGSYQRESESGGIYEGVIKLFPLDGNGLAEALANGGQDWSSMKWNTGVSLHKSRVHAELWLKAILG